MNCNYWIIVLSGKVRIGGDFGIGSFFVELVVLLVIGFFYGMGDFDEIGNVGIGN